MGKEANDLERYIVRALQVQKHVATRINVIGRGGKRSTTTKGTADIIACIFGHYVEIEVKIGGDKQSDAQRAREQEVGIAKGQYWIVKNEIDFLNQYQNFKHGATTK